MPRSVATDLHPNADTGSGAGLPRHSFEIRPNCSLTPQGARLFFASVAAGTLTLALLLTLRGFWPVLPFAGLELAVLAWALHLSMKRGQERETIIIEVDSIVIESVHGAIRCRSVFPRHWTRVKLRTPLSALHPGRLVFESQGRAREVGRFLTEAERRALAARLQQLVGKMNESPPL